MFYSSDPADLRKLYFEAWQKYKKKEGILTDLEVQLVDLIAAHPEFHALFNDKHPDLQQVYSPDKGEVNPFLHLALHQAIREQVNRDEPSGMKHCFHLLVKKTKDPLAAEHLMMEQLAYTLWDLQKSNRPFDSSAYLASMKKLL